ncbi:DUF4169 family protein [Planktomarina temperata]|jgi:hypothetical protein|uniref:DUF4169 family protein n=1 Tax=Planktomarina TaxID=1284657 RepID=UPI000EF00192|nr:DUF4169 family protein [Planktomarina temperata]MDA9077843.1 DUF4169 family protein [bacterium]MBT6020580.1 DUF4169 family protein [Planktomarina temperata]MBT6864700.1 DUF4169 family protein [Planktomarina temperata]MBT8001175.1 DUF4169 family protein [Planktomarina temperata]
MSAPVNLNRFRKAKARAEKSTRAVENSVKFGRSKAQKRLQETKNAAQVQHLDQHKRDP